MNKKAKKTCTVRKFFILLHDNFEKMCPNGLYSRAFTARLGVLMH